MPYITFDDGIHGRENISLISLHRVSSWLNEHFGWSFDVELKSGETINLNVLFFDEHFTGLISVKSGLGVPVEDIAIVKARASSNKD